MNYWKRFSYRCRVMWMFMKLGWDHYWWDHGFQYKVIDKMLEHCEEHWCKDTHYENDKKDLADLKQTRAYYKKYLETDCMHKEANYEKAFLRRYGKLLPRLWD